MKITLGLTGVAQIAPDYAMLKAALVAAQAATPTGRANTTLATPTDPHAALHALFSTRNGVQTSAKALGHRFSTGSPDAEEVP